MHAPVEAHPPFDFAAMAERKDRRPRTPVGNETGALAATGEHDKRPDRQDVAGMRDVVADRFFDGMADRFSQVAAGRYWMAVRLDVANDAHHHAHRFERITSRRRFRRQHDRVGAVKDRVSDAVMLSAETSAGRNPL